MKIIIGAVLIVVVALAGSRRTFTRIRLPLGARHVYLTGTEYIIVGLCLGSQMLDLLDAKTILGLNPLLYLALGWIGLLFGVQLEIPQIARFPKQYFLLAVLQAAVTVLICFIPFLMILGGTDELAYHEIVAGSLVLCAIAIPTGQSSLALISREFKLRRSKPAEILSYVAGIDAIFGLILLGLSFCFHKSFDNPGHTSFDSLVYIGVSLGLGLTMGLVTHLLTRIRCSQEELVLFIIGVVVFGAGAAAYLKLSPLFVTATGGFVIANMKSAKVRILRALSTLEKPLYIVVLLLGGAMIEPGAGWLAAVGLSILYIILRASGKIVSGYVSSVALQKPQKLSPMLGLGLVSQGGIAAPMVVSFHQAYPGELANTVLGVVLAAIIVNELIGPVMTRVAVGKAG